MVFKNGDTSFSGEMEISILSNYDFILNIFTPVIGTLIYSLKANSENLLILNFQEKFYRFAENNKEIRKKWIGMDMSINELIIILLGEIPKTFPKMGLKKTSKNEYRFVNSSEELVLYLNSNGNIELMEKFIDGYLEYRAEISLYKKFSNSYFPRKIKIFDISKRKHWTIITSEIRKIPKEIKPLNFKPPIYLKKYKEDI